ncbi:MAG: hypothetical protein K2H68_02290, partial [Bacteroidales bacterium]|nr:hypothetical protein [Bacteroidales bacterium]
AIESISEQLQKELPGLRGFGIRNLKNMRTFYEEWQDFFNSAAVAAELKSDTQKFCVNKLTRVSWNSLFKGMKILWVWQPTRQLRMCEKYFQPKRNYVK